jgi:uncharacterized membrane protein
MKPNVPPKSGKPGDSALVGRTFEAAHWSGPLPPPSALESYEKILPGAASAIFKMATEEQQHRHALQTQDLKHRIFIENAGLVSAYSLALVGTLMGGWIVYNGANATGFGAILVSLGSLVAASIWKQRQEAQQVSPPKK